MRYSLSIKGFKHVDEKGYCNFLVQRNPEYFWVTMLVIMDETLFLLKDEDVSRYFFTSGDIV